MNWLNSWAKRPVSHRRGHRSPLPRLETLETRYAPAVSFDQATGLLSVSGDEAGSANDVIMAGLNGGFVEVTINGTLHSSDPGSAGFDAALTGATNESVTSIRIQGLAGNDSITLDDGFAAADGQISLEGGNGRDTITGSSQAELILGGHGADELHGGDGGDTLRGSWGADEIFGDADNDRLRGGKDDDTLHGGDGTDTVWQEVDADQTLTDTQLTGRGTDSLSGIEHGDLIGGAGDNRIVASTFTMGSVVIRGELGDDTLVSGKGDDSVVGGDGADFLSNSSEGGNDTLEGGAGNDSISGAAFSDDSMNGGQGNDTLFSAIGNPFHPGDDSLTGGAGADLFVITEGFLETISDAGAEDTVEERPYGPF